MSVGDSVKILITAVDETKTAIASAKNGMKGLSDSAAKLSGLMAAIGGSAIIAGIVSIAKASINTADDLSKLAQKTGISTEKLSLLQPVAEQAGTSMEGLAKGLQKLATNMYEAANGSAPMLESFGKVGVSATDAAGNLRPTEEVLMDLADAFASMPDGAEKSALAVKLFGKSGVELIPFLNQGKKGIGELTDKFKELGLEIDGETGKAAEKFNDTLDTISQAVKGMGNQIMVAAMPAMQAFADGMVVVASNGKIILQVVELIGVGLFGAFAVRGVQAVAALSFSMSALTALSQRFLPILLAIGAWELGKGVLQIVRDVKQVNAEIDVLNQQAAHLANVTAAMQELANTGTLSVATQMRLAREAAERMKASLPGVTQALTNISTAAVAVGEAIKAALDTEVKKAAETVKSLSASYKAVAGDIKSILDKQAVEIEANYKRQALAAQEANLSEQQQMQETTRILVQAEKEKLGAVDDAARQMLDAWRDTYSKAIELARTAGTDVVGIERQSLQEKIAIYSQIETAYRATVDKLIAEESRLAGEVKRIQEEIRQLHMTTDEKIRELGRALMTDEQARTDKRKQYAEYIAKAEQAIAAGNFAQAQEYGKKAMALALEVGNAEAGEYRKSRDAMKEVERLRTQATEKEAQARAASMKGEYDTANRLTAEAQKLRDEASKKDAQNQQDMATGRKGVATATEEVRKAEDVLAQSLEANKAAVEDQALAYKYARVEAEAALVGITQAVEKLRADLLTAGQLKLEFDQQVALASIEKIRNLVEAQAMTAKVIADIKEAKDAVEKFKTDTDNKEFQANLIAKVAKADDAFNAFKIAVEKTDITVPGMINFDKAQRVLTDFRGDVETMLSKPTESVHTSVPDASQVNAEFDRLNRMITHSTHVIHTVQGNAAGGLIQAFAAGGQAFRRARGRIFGPGTGTSDSVPSMLSAGEFVIRSASVRKFGAAFFAALNAGILPKMPRYATGGLVAAATKIGAGATGKNDVIDLRFTIGRQQHTVQSSRDTAMALAGALREISRGA